MSVEIPTTQEIPAQGWRRWYLALDPILVSTVLGLMVILPLSEIVLRKFFSIGIPNVSAIVQHLTLLVGLLGGALAAREDRLLALSPLSTWLKGSWKTTAAIISHAWAITICIFLAVASYHFAASQKSLSQELAFGIPKWWVQMLLPLGFTVIALRLFRHAAPHWKGRVITGVIAALLIIAVRFAGIPPEKCVTPGLIALAIATLLGAPVFTTLAGASLILFYGQGEQIAGVALRHYSLVTNSNLPSIPLFTLAGYFLAEGGASKRLVRVFQALVGSLRGGPAIVTALVCAFFTSFTGASGVTILALGGLLMPVLIAARYQERAALGLLTSAGSLGLLFPPCLPLILYAIVANTSAGANITLKEMFLAGVGPGFLLVAMTAAWGIRSGPKIVDTDASARFSLSEAKSALWDAKWEMLVPVVALVALFSGWATPVEAAAVTALYAFLTQCVIHRDISLGKGVLKVMGECGLLVGGVLLILGIALSFTQWLIDVDAPTILIEWVTTRITSPWLFLIAVNLFLIVVGCLMDIFSAIVVVVPLLAPLAVKYGVDPLHFGIIFLANMELGFLTPPVGMNLFLSSYRFKKSMYEVTRSVLPMLGVLIVGVLLITYLPILSLWLPRIFGK